MDFLWNWFKRLPWYLKIAWPLGILFGLAGLAAGLPAWQAGANGLLAILMIGLVGAIIQFLWKYTGRPVATMIRWMLGLNQDQKPKRERGAEVGEVADLARRLDRED